VVDINTLKRRYKIMAEFASKGVAGSGLGLGIAGTALGVLNGGLGNLLGGWGNGCHATCSENTAVNRYELNQSGTIAKLESDIALRDANIYNDQKLLEVYKYFDGQVKDIRATICANEKESAVNNAKIEGTFAVLGERMAACKNEFMCALNRERDERCCGDNSIVTYLNATFYPKQVADVTVGTTSTAQATYNPVYNCGCGCGCRR
jgi:hypothetical protein